MKEPVIGPAEEVAYGLLLGGAATEGALAAAWTYPEHLPAVLDRLRDAGLVTASPDQPRQYAAADPDAAISHAARTAELLRQARNHGRRLADAYRDAHTRGRPTSVVETVTGERAVARALALLRRGARHEIRSLGGPPDLRATEPGSATWMCVYDQGSVHAGTLPRIEQLIRSGQQARVLPDVPARLWIADRRIALLSADPAHTAVLVYPCALLDALAALFDLMWRRAIPLDLPGAAGHPSPRRASDTERLIGLLLSGLTDEAIARHLGIGHRTAQRRVSTLMAELGARTRFQAGVQAAVRDRWPSGDEPVHAEHEGQFSAGVDNASHAARRPLRG